MGLIRLALIMALIYFVVKIFSRFFFKYLIKKHQKQYDAQSSYQDNRKEGDVSVKYDPKTQKNKSDELGEYVDYEEVEDE